MKHSKHLNLFKIVIPPLKKIFPGGFFSSFFSQIAFPPSFLPPSFLPPMAPPRTGNLYGQIPLQPGFHSYLRALSLRQRLILSGILLSLLWLLWESNPPLSRGKSQGTYHLSLIAWKDFRFTILDLVTPS